MKARADQLDFPLVNSRCVMERVILAAVWIDYSLKTSF